MRHVVHVPTAARRDGAERMDVGERHGPLEQRREHHGQELAAAQLEDLAEAKERAVAGRVVLARGGGRGGRRTHTKGKRNTRDSE